MRWRPSTQEERTASWVNGDPVTSKHAADVTGTVKWTHARRSDGKRFLRVRLANGSEIWGNDDFLIGIGPHQVVCADCLEPFRTDDRATVFCPCCTRHHRPGHDPHAIPDTHAHNILHSTATTRRSGLSRTPATHTTFVTGGKPVTADDDVETPF
jgi:hypothetical protein